MNIGNIVGLLWIIFALIWLFAWAWTKRTQERAPLSLRLLYAVPILIAAYLMFSDNPALARLYSRVIPSSRSLEILALLLTFTGLAFAVWARFYIGENWSGAVTIKVGHELIRRGPYRLVCHPIYSGILLALIGTAVERGRLVDVIGVVLFYVGFLIKSRMEEKFMQKTFGEQYIEYSRSTGALVPKLRT
jgi:protein-S-isoprenylcysteine O-methyltransferase Ste14